MAGMNNDGTCKVYEGIERIVGLSLDYRMPAGLGSNKFPGTLACEVSSSNGTQPLEGCCLHRLDL